MTGHSAPATSATSASTSGGLTPHAESLMRHWASVSEQPQGQPSSFTRRSTSSRCSGVSTDRSTPGISVACAAFASRIWSLDGAVSTVASWVREVR